MAVLGLLFVLPMAAVLWASLDAGDGALTLRYWQRALQDPEFLASAWFSLRISAVSTLLAAPLGLALALGLHRLSRRSLQPQLLARIPLVVPHLVVGYMTILLLGRFGLVARAAFHLGLLQGPDQFPALVYDSFGWGLIFAYVWKEAPFVALMVYPLLGGGVGAWREAARTLGATPFQTLVQVVFPLTWPGLAASMTILFAFSFGSFELPLLLGRTYPRALPVLAYQRFISPDLSQRPEAMFISLVLTAVSLLAALWYLRSIRRLADSWHSVRENAHG